MHYTKAPIERWLSVATGCVSDLLKDWLEQDAKIERLVDAAAAVVDAWTPEKGWDHESHLAVIEAVENLRIAAGLKGEPIDAADGDRADEAYERKGDR